MINRMRPRQYVLDKGGQGVGNRDRDRQVTAVPLQRTFSEAGLKTLTTLSSDDQSSVHSSPAIQSKPHFLRQKDKPTLLSHLQQNIFKKKMLQIIQQSQTSFQYRLQQRQASLYHSQEKYRALEQRFLQTQGQLAQTSAQLRFMAMREAEHNVEIRDQQRVIEELEGVVRGRGEEVARLKGVLESLQGLYDRERNQPKPPPPPIPTPPPTSTLPPQTSQLLQTLTGNIQRYKQLVASLQRQLQHKSLTILHLQNQSPLIITQQQQLKPTNPTPTTINSYHIDEAERLRRKLSAKEHECNSLALKLCEVRGLYEEEKNRGRKETQEEEIGVLRAEARRLQQVVGGLEEQKRGLERRVQELNQEIGDLGEINQGYRYKACQNMQQEVGRMVQVFEETNKEKQQLENRMSDLSHLLIERDSRIESQQNVIQQLQYQLKQVQSNKTEKTQIQQNIKAQIEDLMKKCLYLEQAIHEQKTMSSVNMALKLQEFNALIEQKDKEIEQIHRYASKLQDMVDKYQEKQGNTQIKCDCQMQTDQQVITYPLKQSCDYQMQTSEQVTTQKDSVYSNQIPTLTLRNVFSCQTDTIFSQKTQPQHLLTSISQTQTQLPQQAINPQRSSDYLYKKPSPRNLPKNKPLAFPFPSAPPASPFLSNKKLLDYFLITLTGLLLLLGMIFH